MPRTQVASRTSKLGEYVQRLALDGEAEGHAPAMNANGTGD
jgi:hypothetical protein